MLLSIVEQIDAVPNGIPGFGERLCVYCCFLFVGQGFLGRYSSMGLWVRPWA